MLSRANLYPYQHRAIEFIKKHPNCALWVDMGLGKTVSALTAFGDMFHSFDVDKALVVAPLRVARQVWSDEIDEWSHLQGLRVAKIIGTPEQRLRAMADTRADIYTINREQISWLEEQIIHGKKQVRKWPWDTVILDESQSFKSQTAQRWKSLRRLRRLFDKCVQLTGTPVPNGYGDLWAPLYLLDRGERLGETETAYLERWFEPPDMYSTYSWSLKDHAEKEIQAAVADLVLTMRAEDYLDLPPVLNNTVTVKLSDRVLKKYKKLERDYIMETFAGATVTAVNAAVCRGKLLQLANGSIYLNPQREYEELHDEKIEALLELLEFLPTPVLIGYGFVADKSRLGVALDKFCRSKQTWRVLNKDEDFDAFGAGQIDYAIAHPASMGHGLNKLYKSGSENAVWFGLTDNLEFYQQFNARLTGGHRRVGRNVVIHHILCEDTQDENTYALLTAKGATQDDLKKNMVELAKRVC
jgi:SNF2 family DNA or RNA helicase